MENKTKPYCNEATHFHNKDMSEAGSNIVSLAIIMTDPALQDKNYQQHVFKRMPTHWTYPITLLWIK